jgi:hypothetical protein
MKWIYRSIFKYRFIIGISLIILYFLWRNRLIYEGYQDTPINKTIWLLWLQGWDSAPWLAQQVKKSWELKNPGWTVALITNDNLKDYVTGIDYVYRDTISPQAKSDIIRLSLLQSHGGVWADATLLCLQPLDSWVEEAIEASNFWMYHGTGGGMDIMQGPASWFIVSKKGSYIISKWKAACDEYWKERSSTDNYFWMDALFRGLYEGDTEFKKQWDAVPYISCEAEGQAHMFAEGSWKENTESIKKIIKDSPPRVVKLWEKRWTDAFPTIDDKTKESNGYYAIQKAIGAID